jgi:hypothetical protein
MQQTFVSVNIDKTEPAGAAPDRSFSFRAYKRFLEQQVNVGGIKAASARFLLEQYNRYPGADDDLLPGQLEDYRGLLDMVYLTLTDFTQEEHRMIWGLSMPFKPDIVYGTEALYALLDKVMHLDDDGQTAYRTKQKHTPERYVYAAILERFYNYTYLTGTEEMIHSFIDPDDGLFKYYRFNIDPRFIDIRPVKPLPDLPQGVLEARLCGKQAPGFLEQLLPLSGFRLSGFSVVTLTDVTAQYVIHLIRNLLIRIGSHSDKEIPYDTRQDLVLSLQTLVGSRDIHFGFIPLYLLNGRPIMDWGRHLGGVLLEAIKIKREGILSPPLVETVKQLIKNPRLIYYSESNDPQPSREPQASQPEPSPGPSDEPLIELMKDSGIHSFALLPILYNQEVTGFMEVYTRQKNMDLESRLYKLDNALPYIAQLIKAGVDELDTKLSLTVNELYTAIQPAVQWKFREASWRYLQAKLLQRGRTVAETIRFRDVYPLYGSIDIRNSTIERNDALQEDLQYCLLGLSEVLHMLPDQIGTGHGGSPVTGPAWSPAAGYTGSLIADADRLAGKLGPDFSESDEHEIGHFLQRTAFPRLRALREMSAGKAIEATALAAIDSYLQAMDEQDGEGYRNRRAFEASMQVINRSIGQYLDMMNEELQKGYPCYFEKFRTDGVEFDIYIGQSIAVDTPFDERYLERARIWQLRAMAAVHRLTRALLPQMQRPLYTTQLIFINGRTIDISFRNDEKRFDVEGAYNIRYQVIKKRIDKIRVKDTRERLTQPGKIAIVYYWKQDAEAYFGHIDELRQEGILSDDLEQLELETLQGVAGLKALRISIL